MPARKIVASLLADSLESMLRSQVSAEEFIAGMLKIQARLNKRDMLMMLQVALWREREEGSGV